MWRAAALFIQQYTLFPMQESSLPTYSALVEIYRLASARVLAAESGVGVVMLDDLEMIARVLRVKVVELLFAPGRTAAERLVLGLLDGKE